MAWTQTNFVHGVDCTGLATISASELNQLIDQATLQDDKCIILKSTDTALDTPDTPDTTTYPEYQKYLWLRFKHATDPDQAPILYAFVGTEWVTLIVDISALNAEVSAVSDVADEALAHATLAKDTADGASTAANSAVLKSYAAQTDATTALATANGAKAYTDSSVAIVDAKATAAQTTATTGVTNAAAAQSTADQALTKAANGLISFITVGPVPSAAPSGQTWSNAQSGISGAPTLLRAVLVCISTELNYNEGDELDINCVKFAGTNNYVLVANLSNLSLYLPSFTNAQIPDGFTGALGTAHVGKWGTKIYAFARAV